MPPTPPATTERPPSLLRTAPFTAAMLAICVVVWIVEVLYRPTYEYVALSAAIGRLEPWRFLTSAFAHDPSLQGGVIHLGSNMLALWLLGRALEPAMQTWRFAVIYLVSALGGSVMFVLTALPPTATDPLGWNWYTGVVGASGAIFGLFGALLVVQRRMGQSTRSLWSLLALNVALVFFIPNIAWQAHVGGFIVGVAATWIFFHQAKRGAARGRPAQPWPLLIALVALLVAATVLKYALV